MPIISSNDINLDTLSEIGGKAQGLFFLKNQNFNTPDFFVIPYSTLKEIIEDVNKLDIELNQWKKEYNISQTAIWAVRSSADNEDGVTKSFAGFFTSKINVFTNDINTAVIEVLESYKKIEKQDYTAQKDAQFGIIIQKMIQSEYSGVIFSHDPLNVKDKTMHINIIPGIGENLVSGKLDAYLISYLNGNFNFLNEDEDFSGEIFTSDLKPIIVNGKQIKNDIGKYLSELVKGTKKLYTIKGNPVDIEFTIANNKLYWLQIRPITTGDDEIIIWDNTAAESNYSGITLPLSISVATNAFYRAYSSLAVFVGMNNELITKNQPLLKKMSGEINGRLYYNVTAWQKLIYQLPFGKKAANALPGIWGMLPAKFIPEKYSISFITKLRLLINLIIALCFFRIKKKNYYLLFNKVYEQYYECDLNKKKHAELIKNFKDIENRLGGNWEAPMLNGFFTMLFYSSLKKILKDSRLNNKFPNFINDILFSQKDMISVLIVNDFQDLLFEIYKDPQKKKLFEIQDPKLIFETLEIKHELFFKKINLYISKYGDRSEEGELKMETVNYKEDPLTFITFLSSCAKSHIKNKPNKIEFDYKKALNETYGFNFIKKVILIFLINQTIKRVRDRENFRYMRTSSFGLMRRIFRAIDEQLLKEKLIVHKGDSLYLVLDEIENYDLRDNYKQIIEQRKEKYKNYFQKEVYTRYIQRGDSLIPETMDTMMTEDFLLKGVGCSSGIVKAEVKLIEESTNLEDCYGKILIANYFEPGKLNLFSQSAGIISVRGNLLSHTAILCREMGIPAIVSARGLLQKVKDGDVIEMNGATGTIKLNL